MKKYFFLTAIAAFALCSCVKDEPDGLWDKTKITFESPVISSLTKAPQPGEIEGTASYPTNEKFSVYASYTEAALSENTVPSDIYNYMSNVMTAYATDLNGWDPAAVEGGVSYYWPKHGYLTFAAYSPSELTGSISWTLKNGFTLTGFEVDNDNTAGTGKNNTSKQYDLMFSKLEKNNKKSTMVDNQPYDGVEIKFGHALSSIKFKLGSVTDGVSIDITKITIKNVYSKGNYVQNLKSDYSNDYDTEKGGQLWKDQSTPVDYIVYDGTTNTGNSSFLNSADVILLPQELYEQNEHNVIVRVEYDMSVQTGNSIPQFAEISLRGLKNKDDNSTITEWEIGKRYTYEINFSYTAADKIYFAPIVDNWDDITISGPSI